MRTLTDKEVYQVAGGGWIPRILTSASQVGKAQIFGRALGMIGTSFYVGHTIGTWIYNNGLDDYLADVLSD